MPPKRKNPPSAAIEPPTKRVTRSRAAATPQPVLEKPTRATKGKRTTKPVVEVKSDDDEEEYGDTPPHPTRATRSGMAIRTRPAPAQAPSKAARSATVQKTETKPQPLRKRGRPRNKKPDLAKELSPEPFPATSSKVTIEALRDADDESEPDELLLVSERRILSTPPRKMGAVAAKGTPRMVLDAVEVPTPSKKMRDIQNVVSPKVTSPVKPTASPVKRLTQRDTTPTRSKASVQPLSTRPAHPEPPAPTENIVSTSPSSKLPSRSPTKSPRKGKEVAAPSRLPHSLPSHLHAALDAQKRATLKALHEVSVLPCEESKDPENAEPFTNAVAFDQLCSLLRGTAERGEGNSCMVIGPKGSGKTQIVERAISALRGSPIVIRLSGYAQTNDRLAIREIAWQLAEQTGQALIPTEHDDSLEDEENPFIETNTETVLMLPPPSHLLALISMLPTLPHPTIIVLDAFDLFALHARQSLLYCLLDTVQSCRAISGNKGIAVVGVTTRVETINILEKRVKSRFSGRIIRTAGLPQLQNCLEAVRQALCSQIADDEDSDWSNMWSGSVDSFLHDPQVVRFLKETYALTKDVRVLGRLLASIVATLRPSSPALSAQELATAITKQRCPSRFSFLNSLTYPSICLLIAAVHARTSGHEAFTFEMLHNAFQDQVRTSMSAPVTVDGGGIGMVRCSREVLFGAFEKLVFLQVFVATTSAVTSTGKEFVKYRCNADRLEIKIVVDRMGQLNLKKWLNKAQ